LKATAAKILKEVILPY